MRTSCSPPTVRPERRKQGRAGSSSTRSSGRGPGPCATSWPPSSRTRTTSSGPTPRRPSACRARRAPGRRPSACTGWPTCSTRTGSRSAGAEWSSSGRTRPSCPTSATCCPLSARWTSPRRPSPSWSDAGSAPRPRIGRRGGRELKGDARMAEVLRRARVGLGAAAGRGRGPAARHPALAGGRLGAGGAGPRAARTAGVRYGAARELLEHRIAHVILTQMEAAGEACDDRTHEAVRRSRPVRSAVEAIWPKVDPGPAGIRAAVVGRRPWPRRPTACSTPDEQAAIVWSPPRAGPGRPAGHRPTWCSSTRRAT